MTRNEAEDLSEKYFGSHWCAWYFLNNFCDGCKKPLEFIYGSKKRFDRKSGEELYWVGIMCPNKKWYNSHYKAIEEEAILEKSKIPALLREKVIQAIKE